MEQMSRTERAALCNSALEAGETAPTLCAGWAVKDLVIHLLIRERDPIAATAIMVPQLEKVADRKANRLAQQDFTALVERVRNGPPRWSPMAIPPVDQLVNSLEYFVHHEDIRRAQPSWSARSLDDATFTWVVAHDAPDGWEPAEKTYYDSPERAGLPRNPADFLASSHTKVMRPV